MHSFLQRKLKNLHGEARVWGSSTPRPPPLIVQPKGGLSSKARSRVHGARVPGGEQFAHRRGGSRGAGTQRGGRGGHRRQRRSKCRSERGSPPGSQRRGHTPVGLNVTLWEFSKEAAGLRAEGERVEAPFQVPASGGTRSGSHAGPGLPDWWLRAPSLLLLSAWSSEP